MPDSPGPLIAILAKIVAIVLSDPLARVWLLWQNRVLGMQWGEREFRGVRIGYVLVGTAYIFAGAMSLGDPQRPGH